MVEKVGGVITPSFYITGSQGILFKVSLLFGITRTINSTFKIN